MNEKAVPLNFYCSKPFLIRLCQTVASAQKQIFQALFQEAKNNHKNLSTLFNLFRVNIEKG
jgi:hypothetical protein